MAFQILPYTEDSVGAVCDFNQRLLSGGAPADQLFPETPDPRWMPGMELFLAMEDGEVRGGYILRNQTFFAAGEGLTAAHYRLPVSEGTVNRAYATLGLRMVRDALARQPRLYAMGMGGWDKPLPQMLKRLGWEMCAVPFHFKVVHPSRFLRHIRPLRTTLLHRAVLDAAALSGAGWLGMKAFGMARRLPAAPCDLAAAFAPWADEVWDVARGSYSLLAQRDAATLDQLYPPADPRFVRVRAAGGWALLLDTRMQNHKHFGDMRVGTIVDCLAPPASAAAIVRAATALLEQRGVDLIVSNQLHPAWSQALQSSGFRSGPSNYLLALSPALARAASGQATIALISTAVTVMVQFISNRKSTPMQALAIMYHDVVENGDFESSGFPGEGAHVYKLRAEDFVCHLDAIAAATSAVGSVRQLEGRPVLLTFDDGGASAYHPIAGLLERRGWRGHFFITTNRIGTPGFLTEAQVRELHRRGHIVGSHSSSHPTRMAALTRAELDREWRQSIDRLSSVIGEPVKTASVPGGYYSREVGESAAAAGIEALFTSEPTSQVGLLNGCRVLGRYVIQRGMAPQWSAGFAAGNPAQCWRQSALWKAKRIAKTLGGGFYLQVRQAILERKR